MAFWGTLSFPKARQVPSSSPIYLPLPHSLQSGLQSPRLSIWFCLCSWVPALDVTQLCLGFIRRVCSAGTINLIPGIRA